MPCRTQTACRGLFSAVPDEGCQSEICCNFFPSLETFRAKKFRQKRTGDKASDTGNTLQAGQSALMHGRRMRRKFSFHGENPLPLMAQFFKVVVQGITQHFVQGQLRQRCTAWIVHLSKPFGSSMPWNNRNPLIRCFTFR